MHVGFWELQCALALHDLLIMVQTSSFVRLWLFHREQPFLEVIYRMQP